ncbi:MAG TPA: hypothetical protein VJN93_04975 [Candidatus Acidoferrum sp.]|nr:hypothetical protein [Candidatus Acidoferrum sp.]
MAGMDPLTLIHVGLSLVGIFTGLIAVLGMIAGRRLEAWTAVFLSTTALTSITGFFFPFHTVTPGIVLGILSLIVLAVAIPARYVKKMEGAWLKTYVISSTIALYFNVFVLVVQLFLKVPSLHALAPSRLEPPFLVSQLVVLMTFFLLAITAALKFHPEPAAA